MITDAKQIPPKIKARMLIPEVQDPPKFVRQLTEQQWKDLKTDSDRATAMLGGELEAADQHIFNQLKTVVDAIRLNEARSIERWDNATKKIWAIALLIAAAVALKYIHP